MQLKDIKLCQIERKEQLKTLRQRITLLHEGEIRTEDAK